MNRPPATRADFSQFTIQQMVEQSDRTLLSGKFTKPGRHSSGQHLCLFISLEDAVFGNLSELDPDAATAVFDISTESTHPAIVVGATFPVYDPYWFGKIRLALDQDVHWTRMQFVAPDAFVQPSETPGWRVRRIAEPGDKERTDGYIMPGGWDHEHCELCWHKIGNGGEPDGYVAAPNNWVCVRCYDRFIKSRDLRFVIDGAPGDSDELADSLTRFHQFNLLIDDYDLAAIRQFLEDGENVNARSRYGWTPLMLAALRGHQSVITLLLDAGADVNAISEQHGNTALALAAQEGRVEVVERLLAAGAKAEVPETFCGGSLLAYVNTGRGRGNARILELLTQAGAK